MRMSVQFAVVTLMTLFGLALAPPSQGAGMQIKMGEWEFRNWGEPDLANQGEIVERTCVDEPEMTPEKFSQEAPCELIDPKSDASSMSWKLRCDMPGGSMRGDASFRSTGTSVEGAMTMTMDASGHSMTMTRHWRGKRLGPCPDPNSN